MADKYITVFGESFLDPIVSLFERLKYKSSNNEVQTSMYENGYSTSIIILTAIMLESLLARARFFREQEGNSQFDRSVLKYTKKYLDIGDNNIQILNELFVLRDIIAHNHIWESTIDQKGGLKFVDEPSLEEVYGDPKFRNFVLLDKRITKNLGFNIFPTRICKVDAVLYFENTYKILKTIEDLSRLYVYISHLAVHYKDEYITIEDFISKLREEVDFI